MMKLYVSNWILIFFMLWLPVQGVTAAVFSVCVQENFGMNHDSVMTASEDHHHDDCHKQQPGHKTTDNHAISSLPCDDTSCNASSNTLILSDYSAAILPVHSFVIAALNSGFISFVPEQPQHPPLTSFL